MAIDRRRLLQLTGTGCALAMLPSVPEAASSLRRYQVQDSVALPRFAAGDVVVADTGVSHFTDAGLYLYPAWGQPRLYEVRAVAKRLEFRNPGTGQLLWSQSAELDSAFSGRVLGQPQAAALLASCPVMSVPAHPATA